MQYNFNRKLFEKIVRKDQLELKRYLKARLEDMHYTIEEGDGWLLGKGTLPILLLAHMDTVHKNLVTDIYYSKNEKAVTAVEGIGGDDRCGVYMALELAKALGCWLLFTEDEEKGCIGASKFAKVRHPELEKEIKYLVQFDRKNAKDAVFYDCDNKEFTAMVLQYGFEKDWGSFSDISEVAPALGLAAVNLSCGYYNPHTTNEYVRINEMMAQVERAAKMIINEHDKQYEYVQSKNSWYGWGTSRGWHTLYDTYYDDPWEGDEHYGKGSSIIERKMMSLEGWWGDNLTVTSQNGYTYTLDREDLPDLFLDRENNLYEYFGFDKTHNLIEALLIDERVTVRSLNNVKVTYIDDYADFCRIVDEDYVFSDAMSEEEELELKEAEKEAE